MKFNTKAVHAGVDPDPSTGAIMTPIFQTSTYVQAAPGDHKGYEYARTQNPTRHALEKSLAALENGSHAVCFSSGMAAVDAAIKLLDQGDEVISTNDLYGGTYRSFTKIYSRFGLGFHFTDLTNPENILPLINSNTKMIWVETPTNPMLNIIDIEAVAAIARGHGLLLVVDNTFASPYLQNPLDLGADIVLHSATKYLGGHSDVVHGTLIVKDPNLAERLFFIQNGNGAVPGPQDCFLVLRGIKTLHLRMQRACENAARIARFLHDHPKVDKVYWPGFEHHPNHAIAAKQMRDFGAMVSFTLHGDDYDEALRVLSNTHLFSLAESLGGVESLIGHPASMTHASIPKEERLKTGLVDSLIRLSIGIEDGDDLIEDLQKQLDNMDFRTLSLLALAIGPAIAIMAFVYARDVHDREPFGVLLMSFFWGCFSVVPAIILETILPGLVPGSSGSGILSIAIYTFVIIAFSEEFSKYIFLRYYSYRKRSFNEPFDGIIYMVMVGMGFATIENLMYVFGADTPQNQWATAGMRAITAVPAHASFAIVMGYYAGLAKFSKDKEKQLLMQGILYATILHGFYDFFLFQNISEGIAIGALVSLIIGIRFSEGHAYAQRFFPLSESPQLLEAITSEDEDEGHFESPYKPS